jgi:hypothetical protein
MKKTEIIETQPQRYCACGCGELTMPGNTFIRYHHVRINNPMSNPESVKKLKGNSNPSKRTEVRKKISNALTGYKHTEKARENMKRAQLKRKNDNPEAWKRMSEKGARNNRKKHPNLFEKTLQQYYKDHPKKRSERAMYLQNRWKEQNPENFKKVKEKCVTAMLNKRKQMKREDPEQYHVLYSQAALKRLEKVRRQSPFSWNGVGFLSKEERKCAKLLLSKPQENINCHVKIGRKIIDFFPQQDDILFRGCFVEFHPWNWDGLTTEQYYEQRKNIIDDSEYKGTKLIVITDLNKVKEMVRNGKTKENN